MVTFTFQSGSILIAPLPFSVSACTVFTFQSGSILMNTETDTSLTAPNFTFQSGSILIVPMAASLRRTLYLYIPIWFYSNYGIVYFKTASNNLTFQSGSILIIAMRTLLIFMISLHSNLVLF